MQITRKTIEDRLNKLTLFLKNTSAFFLIGTFILMMTCGVLYILILVLFPVSWKFAMFGGHGNEITFIYKWKTGDKNLLFIQDSLFDFAGGSKGITSRPVVYIFESVIDMDSFELLNRNIIVDGMNVLKHNAGIILKIDDFIFSYNSAEGVLKRDPLNIKKDTILSDCFPAIFYSGECDFLQGEVKNGLKSWFQKNPELERNIQSELWNFKYDSDTGLIWIPAKDGLFYSIDSDMKAHLTDKEPVILPVKINDEKWNFSLIENMELPDGEPLKIPNRGVNGISGSRINVHDSYPNGKFMNIHFSEDTNLSFPIFILQPEKTVDSEGFILSSLEPDGKLKWKIFSKSLIKNEFHLLPKNWNHDKFVTVANAGFYKNKFILIITSGKSNRTSLGVRVYRIDPLSGNIEKEIILR